MSPEARHILLHTLGLQPTVEGFSYRNRYVSGPTPPAGMAELVDLGLMVERQWSGFLLDGRSWGATDKGMAAALVEHATTLPKLTAAQRRYRRWLSETDANGETFGAWLRRQGRREDDETVHYRSQG